MTSLHDVAVIVAVEPLDGYRLRLRFDDGFEREVDLEGRLHGPVFEPMRRSMDYFRRVCVDEDAGTIAWPNGVDLDPDVLRGTFPPDDPTAASGRHYKASSPRTRR